MNEIRRVFLDTAPVIYYVQRNEIFFEKVKNALNTLNDSGVRFVSSDVTTAEACVYPYRLGRRDWLETFDKFLNIFRFEIMHSTDEIARKTARIRAEYPSFKTMDSFQLASAVVGDCQLFLTNDKRLCQFKELKCCTIDSFEL